jgi:hypothetical protein
MKEEKTFHLGDLVIVLNEHRPSTFYKVGIVVGEDLERWTMYKVFVDNGSHWFHPYELQHAEY